MSRINGWPYDMHRIDFRVPFGVTERWRFTTGGNAPHPVHVHGTSFQVVSRTGGRGRTFPWEGGWKDTVLLNDTGTVEILIRFDKFRGAYDGRYLIHCHQLEHEDMGMMSNFGRGLGRPGPAVRPARASTPRGALRIHLPRREARACRAASSSAGVPVG